MIKAVSESLPEASPVRVIIITMHIIPHPEASIGAIVIPRVGEILRRKVPEILPPTSPEATEVAAIIVVEISPILVHRIILVWTETWRNSVSVLVPVSDRVELQIFPVI